MPSSQPIEDTATVLTNALLDKCCHDNYFKAPTGKFSIIESYFQNSSEIPRPPLSHKASAQFSSSLDSGDYCMIENSSEFNPYSLEYGPVL